MRTVNMHEAKTHLSRLVEGAANGESFIIARAGKPLVTVTAIAAPTSREASVSPGEASHRFDFLAGQFDVPDDFDRMAEDEIADLFDGKA